MVNYYEILEVNQNASKEVIEKAYRVLAKKYHPDLQNAENKQISEEKMKKINEAYEILINDQKRAEHDEKLREEIEYQKEKEIDQRINEVIENNKQNYESSNYEQQKNTQEKYNEESNVKQIQNEMRRAYAKAYNDYWRSRGYKIKEPWTFKRFINLLKVIVILLIIILAIWFFPPTNKLIIEFYEGNVIVKSLVDIIINIFKGLGNGIVNFFTNL